MISVHFERIAHNQLQNHLLNQDAGDGDNDDDGDDNVAADDTRITMIMLMIRRGGGSGDNDDDDNEWMYNEKVKYNSNIASSFTHHAIICFEWYFWNFCCFILS